MQSKKKFLEWKIVHQDWSRTFNNEIKFEITYNEMIKLNPVYVIVLNVINTSKSVAYTIAIVFCNFQVGIIFFCLITFT